MMGAAVTRVSGYVLFIALFVLFAGLYLAAAWIDRQAPAILSAGDVLHAVPHEEHFVRNPFDETFRAVFVKTPWVDGDKVDKPWTPDASAS